MRNCAPPARPCAATVRTLGFDPASQDDFPSGNGELRQWLRAQLDSCEGLIQLVGHAYGAEPPEADPEYGRVSYTQFEFLYARKQNKKTWVIVIGKDFGRDKPPDQLDLPRDPDHPDPTGYQAERRQLQQEYLARLKRENHLRHTANSDIELQNVVLRLRDELGELRQRAERKERRLTALVIAILLGLVVLGGIGWWGYHQLQSGVQQVGVMNTEKIRAHLLQTAGETHRRELAEAEAATDWKKRQPLREAADNAHAIRLSRIEELAVSFSEIDGRDTGTSVFQEMTRILTEQGVDAAISYVDTERASIFQTVRARAAAAREHNRADLLPLLQTAALQQAKGQAAEARTLYTDILDAEPDWPEALHAFFLFLADQGELARVRTTLADARRDYEEAHRIAQHLTSADPGNKQWQRDLSVSYSRLGDLAMAQGQWPEAARVYGKDLEIAQKLVASDPSNTQWQRDLSVSYNKLGDLAMAQGQWPEAARVYGKDLEIAQKLVASDPSNTQWQRECSVSYNKLGDLARAQGQWPEAARVYSEALKIRKILTEKAPLDTDWQRDLWLSYERLGDVAVDQGKLTEASEAFGKGLEIVQKLAARDLDNTQWQRDLTIFYDHIGDVVVAQGKLAEGGQVYGDALKIRITLTEKDPLNMDWQRDLWISYWKLGNLTERRNDTKGARTYWKQAYDVLSGIDKRGLHLSPEDRKVLETLRRKVGADAR